LWVNPEVVAPLVHAIEFEVDKVDLWGNEANMPPVRYPKPD